jgi:hypothetical protein
MPVLTVIVGIALTALGIVAYELSGAASLTALIPSAFGVIFVVLGILARNERRLKLTMHLAVGLALLGFLASVQGWMALPALLSGEEVARPAAVISRSIMALALLVLLVAGVRSFIAARRARQTA